MSKFTDGLKTILNPGNPNQPAQTQNKPVTQMRPRTRQSRGGNEVQQIDTQNPKSYAEAGQIADVLRDGISVIVNCESMTDSDKRRLVDFMAGLKAGLQAESKRVSDFVYLLAPYGVEIEGDADEVLEAEGDRNIIRP